VDAQGESQAVACRLEWRKSSRCGSDACVEVAIHNEKAYVRSSNDAVGAYLVFDAEEWRSFLAGVRNHEFDIGEES
jgi:predicted secreted Zn-dependent protease